MSAVKAGDLAIIKCAEAHLNGRIVEVLFAAPPGDFQMPDGNLGRVAGDPTLHWAVRFIGGTALVPTNVGMDMRSHYGIAPDWCLYPLPGDPDTIEEPETDEVPA